MMDDSVDDAAISRAQDVLTAQGIDVELGVVRDMLNAAATPEPEDIPVSLGMIAAGRGFWLANPSGSVHVLLPALYRVMEQRRRDEANG